MTFPTKRVTAGIEEETYNTWTNVWTRDYGAGATLFSCNVDDDGRVYTSDVFAGMAYLKDYSGAEVNTANYMYVNLTVEASVGIGPARSFSRTEKYVLGIDTTIMTQIDVWREGQNITTINPLLDEPDIAALWDIQISPNGKYIAIMVVSTATGNNRHVLLYEGS